MKHTDKTLPAIRALLPEEWSIYRESSGSRIFNILDSYCGSLLISDMVLFEYPGDPARLELLPAKIEYELDGPLNQKSFNPFALRCDALKQKLDAALGEWRIGRLAQGKEGVERYRIENSDRKGVARLLLRTFRCNGSSAVTAAELNPYRGYSRETSSLRRRIESIYPTASVASSLHMSLPDQIRWFSEPVPDVLPTEGAREAVVNLVRYILNRVRHYEPGVSEDSDPEILHQYRVSIRRIRSLVLLLKKVFLPHEQETMLNELKSAMQGTNRLRDLDVQAVALEALRPSIPSGLQPGLTSLIKGLETERRKEFKSVHGLIDSAPFDARFSKVTAILDSTRDTEQATISDMLASALVKRYRRIARETDALADNLRPEQLHSLRVSCKKLRYLVDFFPEILRGDLVAPLLKRLKKLQNLLGRYNDLFVMEKSLTAQVDRYSKDNIALMAIGAVIMQTYLERDQLGKLCVAEARAFCSTGNKRSVGNAVLGEKN